MDFRGEKLYRTTTTEREACMKYLFLFTISMHERTITVVVAYNDTQIYCIEIDKIEDGMKYNLLHCTLWIIVS